MLGLIDGDILLYQAAHAVERDIHWGDDLWSTVGDLREAKQTYEGMVSEIVDTLRLKDFRVCLSSFENFRRDINPKYKANRGGRKPTVFKPLKDWALDQMVSRMLPSLEADDVMGIMASQPGGEDCVMITLDKDLRTIPGKHWNQNKRDLGIQTVTPAEAEYNWLCQTLSGDAVDGYSGIPGVGPFKAKKILDAHGPSWETVVNAYLKAGLTAEDALMNARMARILTDDLWDAVKQVPRLWSPT